jgi:hypothetical protein
MDDFSLDLTGLNTPNLLELSTTHLSLPVAEWCKGKCCMENEHGFFFNVLDAEGTDCHPHVATILKAAHKAGFHYVWFDSDAAVCASLPAYDW